MSMFRNRRLDALSAAVVLIAALCGQLADAANMKVSNVAAVEDGNVRFDISWDDSWRASWKEADIELTNWDAAWIFVKYRKQGEPHWNHATLGGKDADHWAPEGAKINVGLTADKGMGVFLYRAAEGKGTWTNNGVKVKWLHKDDGVDDPAKAELCVHALEMVYVPRGAFKVGSGALSYISGGSDRKQEAGSLAIGPWKHNDRTTHAPPFEITGEAELKMANAPGCLWGTFNMGPEGTLPAEFPKGHAAFYCMKYEMNQGQYAAFLSQIAEPHAAKRYPRPTIPARFAGNGIHTVEKSATGYAASKPDRACNWISWDDGAAYADWAAMRPMTELEYEKACRGPCKPVPCEYAWGIEPPNFEWADRIDVPPPVPYPVGICGPQGRAKAGSTYWGIATMSGHLRERTVTVGNVEGRAFKGTCGDGRLNGEGMADVAGWPGPSTAGIGFHGGPWYKDKVRLQVSDRFLAVCLRPQRSEFYGFRGVRQAP